MAEYATPHTSRWLERPQMLSADQPQPIHWLWRSLWHRRRNRFGSSLDWADDRLLEDIGADPRRPAYAAMVRFLLMAANH